MLLLELWLMHSHTWVTDYKADTSSVQFYFVIKIEDIPYIEQLYNWGKILSKSRTKVALFNLKSWDPGGHGRMWSSARATHTQRGQ